MTVDELLVHIRMACPRFDDDAMRTWAAVFHQALKRHEGPALAEAHLAVMSRFKPQGRTPFPLPVEYLEALPTLHKALANLGGPRLDLKAHGEQVRALVADWKLRQGNEFCRFVPAVLRAVADIATERANLLAYTSPDAGPLILTRDEMLIGLHRAVSLARKEEFGMLRAGSKREAWWQQITDIMHGWGFEAVWADWQDGRFAHVKLQSLPPSRREADLVDMAEEA